MLSLLKAALALAAISTPAQARLNPFDNPTLRARFDPRDVGSNLPQPGAILPSNTTTRFRNERTESYFVSSLPDVNFPFGEMYAGAISLNTPSSATSSTPGSSSANTTSGGDEMFFIFMPKESGEPVSDLTIWLNGGPGCSSMEGFLQEVGPISWQSGTYAPVRNLYAWTNATNMLFVDQPIGTGYSRGRPTATSQAESAAQFLAFLRKFQETFGIANYRIFLAGESYAGRYIPYIANAMLDSNDKRYFNVSGAIIYDGIIGNQAFAQQQAVTYPYVRENWSHFGFNKTDMGYMEQRHRECGFEAYLDRYLTFPASGVQPAREWIKTDPETMKCDMWNSALIGVLSVNPCFDPYESNKPCPILWDVLGMSGIGPHIPAGTTVYFDRPDVKRALHVPPEAEWVQCAQSPVYVGGGGRGGPGQNGDLSPDPIQSALPRLIEATNRVLIANGDFDYMIITNGTLLAIQNMTWAGGLGFNSRPAEPLVVPMPDRQYRDAFVQSGLGIEQMIMPQGMMGIQHFERGLMWNQVWGAGHMMPAYQPRVAFMQLLWMLGRIERLGPQAGPAGTGGGGARGEAPGEGEPGGDGSAGEDGVGSAGVRGAAPGSGLAGSARIANENGAPAEGGIAGASRWQVTSNGQVWTGGSFAIAGDR